MREDIILPSLKSHASLKGSDTGTSFGDRFIKDMVGVAKGFFPGMLEIGKTVAHDSIQPFTSNPDYRGDDLVKAMAKGFNEESFIPKLLTGQPIDAWNRFSDKPFSGMLDASLALPAAGAVIKGGQAVGSAGSKSKFAAMGGYKPLKGDALRKINFDSKNPLMEGPAPRPLGKTIDFADGTTGMSREYFLRPDIKNIGGKTYARRTKRTIIPGAKPAKPGKDGTMSDASIDLTKQYNDSILKGDKSDTQYMQDDWMNHATVPRSKNEILGQIADKSWDSIMGKLSADNKFFGTTRIGKKATRSSNVAAMIDTDAKKIEFVQTQIDFVKDFRNRHPEAKKADGSIMADEDILELAGKMYTMKTMGVHPDNILKVSDDFKPTSDIVDLHGQQYIASEAAKRDKAVYDVEHNAVLKDLYDMSYESQAFGPKFRLNFIDSNGQTHHMTPDFLEKNPQTLQELTASLEPNRANLDVQIPDVKGPTKKAGVNPTFEQKSPFEVPASTTFLNDTYVKPAGAADNVIGDRNVTFAKQVEPDITPEAPKITYKGPGYRSGVFGVDSNQNKMMNARLRGRYDQKTVDLMDNDLVNFYEEYSHLFNETTTKKGFEDAIDHMKANPVIPHETKSYILDIVSNYRTSKDRNPGFMQYIEDITEELKGPDRFPDFNSEDPHGFLKGMEGTSHNDVPDVDLDTAIDASYTPEVHDYRKNLPEKEYVQGNQPANLFFERLDDAQFKSNADSILQNKTPKYGYDLARGGIKDFIERYDTFGSTGNHEVLIGQMIQDLGKLKDKNLNGSAYRVVDELMNEYLNLQAKLGVNGKDLVNPAAFIGRIMDEIDQGGHLSTLNVAEMIQGADHTTKLDPNISDVIRKSMGDSASIMKKVPADEAGIARAVDEVVSAKGNVPPNRMDLSDKFDEMSGKSYNNIVTKLRDLKNRRYRLQTLLKKTEGARMNDGNVGIGQMLEDISNDPNIKAYYGSDSIKEFSNYTDDMIVEYGNMAREWMGDDLLGDSRIASNQSRFADWSLPSDEAAAVSGGFHTVRGELPPNVDSYSGPKETRLTDPRNKGVGSAYDAFLDGEFRTDPRVHLDDYVYNQEQLQKSHMSTLVQSSGLNLTKEKYAGYVEAGIIMDDVDVGKKSKRTPMVRINNNGPISAIASRLTKDLEEMIETLEKAGDPESATLMRRTSEKIAHHDRTKSGFEKGYRADQADPVNRSITKEEFRVMPTPMYEAIIHEMGTGKDVLGSFLKGTSAAWKLNVLHARFPAWFRNNFIGAALMLMVSAGPINGTKALASMAKNPKLRKMYVKNSPDLITSGSSHIARLAALEASGGLMKVPGMKKVFEKANKLSDLNSKFADEPFRIASLDAIMTKRVKMLQNHAKAQGRNLDDTPELRERIMTDPIFGGDMKREVLEDMVDFSNMGRYEREIMTAVMPFYSWMKGSSYSAKKLIGDNPEKVWAAEQIGDVGIREAHEDMGGAIPELAESWWSPFGRDSKYKVNTGGWNPYETPVSLLSTAVGAIPGGASYRQFGSENLFAATHPFISGGVEAVTGKDLFFGTPTKNEGWGTAFLKNQAGLPPVQFMTKMIQNKQGGRSMFNRSRGMTLANYLGVPVVSPRMGAVYARGVDESQEQWQNRRAMMMFQQDIRGVSR